MGLKGVVVAEDEGGQCGCRFCGDNETREAMVASNRKSVRCRMFAGEPGWKLWRGVKMFDIKAPARASVFQEHK
jgi:hypothetical protein